MVQIFGGFGLFAVIFSVRYLPTGRVGIVVVNRFVNHAGPTRNLRVG